MKFVNLIFILAAVMGLVFAVAPVQAAEGSAFVPDCVASGDPRCDDVSVFIVLAITIGRYVFSFVGAVALLFFVYGGFLMIISRGNQEKIGQGTQAMTAAVIGLVVAFSGYALVSFLAKSVELKPEFRTTYLGNEKV